ncbi:MAG: hypothetical protein DI626_06135, partial [Micavibrio aeruginosavorus]
RRTGQGRKARRQKSRREKIHRKEEIMSLSSHDDIFEDVSNALDSVEEILSANEWAFDRMGEDELTVQVTGKMGEYRLFFHWQEEHSAMRFCCQYDLDIRRDAIANAATAMTEINSTMWLGHFAFREGTEIPCFRHTALFRGQTQNSGAEHMEDMVDIALSECERYYALFELLSRSKPATREELELAMMQPVGAS